MNKTKKEKIENNTTQSKYKKIKGPRKILKSIFANFKKKNVYKQPSFWLANILFFFFTLKSIQMALYLSHFSVPIPREEAMNNLIYMDNSMMRNMKPEVLYKYLDELEIQKKERQIQKVNLNSNNKI